MSKVPDSLDPVDVAVAAHDAGREHIEAAMREADISIDLRAWFPDDPTCVHCGQSIQAGQWITSDGAHHACAEQHPDAMVWRPAGKESNPTSGPAYRLRTTPH